jgi:glycosyltransferase involved in cell wall biosynthesis
MNSIVISINAAWNIVNFRKGLIRALQQEGYRVVALAPPDSYSSQLAELGVEYFEIEIDKKGMSPHRDLMLLWRYFSLLRKIRPGAFIGYTAKPNIYGSLAAHWLGIPVVNNVSGLGTAFIKQGFLETVVSSLYRLAFRKSQTVFFQNPQDLDLFVSQGIVRSTQAGLLPGSGIDLSRFVPALRTSDDQRFTFLLIGRLLRDKGVREFVEAARIVRGQYPQARFQLLGFVDAENRTAVSRAEVGSWVSEGVIEYLGDTADVRPFIAEADCIVLPSYREGLPRSLLEGAAMAKPLIATDVPGCRHVVDHGSNGYLCEVRSPGSLADAMLTMLRLTPAERGDLGKAGRAKIEAEFDERIVTDRYLQALADLNPTRDT